MQGHTSGPGAERAEMKTVRLFWERSALWGNAASASMMYFVW